MQGRSLAAVDHITEKYSKFMKIGEILEMFCKLRLNKFEVMIGFLLLIYEEPYNSCFCLRSSRRWFTSTLLFNSNLSKIIYQIIIL